MFTSHNPFGGWAEGSGGQAPSIFGALPYPTAQSSDFIICQFISLRPDVLNCTIVGPQSQVYFQITTDPNNPGYTVLKDAKNKSIALVEWQAHPMVEIRGLLPKQEVRHWLRLSADRTSRSMEVKGVQYIWTPQERSINLYTKVGSKMLCVAKITRGTVQITLEMAPGTFRDGLLDPIVVATLLLQCGRNVD